MGGVTYQRTIPQSSFVNGALSKQIKNGSQTSKNTGLSYRVIFLEEDEVCGCWNKWRGATWGP